MYKLLPKIYFYFEFNKHRLIFNGGLDPRASSSHKTVDVYKNIMFVFMSKRVKVWSAIYVVWTMFALQLTVKVLAAVHYLL